VNGTWQSAIQYSLQILEHNMNTLEDFPESCKGEHWELYNRQPRHMNWVTGFWAGLLWLDGRTRTSHGRQRGSGQRG
jgi:hypothetical protein